MAKKSWESKPWVWFGIVVASGVVTAVVSNALSKYWGLMKLQQQIEFSQKTQSAQVYGQPILGKYQPA